MSVANAHTFEQFHERIRGVLAGTDLLGPAGRSASGSATANGVLGALSSVARRLGTLPELLDAREASAVREAGFALSGPIPRVLVARVCILCGAVCSFPEAGHAEFFRRAYRTGGNDERIALLRSLPHLPSPGRFREIAYEACRTHVDAVFEAIACDNTYPGQHFEDLPFRQLVMKALFVGCSLRRVDGLAGRIDDELIRMVRDFAAERRAAARAVPTDVTLIVPDLEIPS